MNSKEVLVRSREKSKEIQNVPVPKPQIPEGILIFFAIVIVMSSSLTQIPIEIRIGSIYPVHLVAVLVFPLFFNRDFRLSRLSQTVALGLLATVLLGLPSLALPEPWSRYRIIFQLISNAPLVVLGAALLAHLNWATARRFVTALTIVVATGVAVQMALLPNVATRPPTSLGIYPPSFTFTEEAWLATFCSLLIIACLLVSSNTGVVLMLGVLFLADNRGAFLIAAVAIAFSFKTVFGNRFLRVIVLLVPFGISLSSVLATVGLLQTSVFVSDETLNSRYAVARAELAANPDGLFWWGGSYFSNHVHNQWWHEWVIRFGATGLLMLLIWGLLISVLLPRLSGANGGRNFWIATGGFWAFFHASQFNNAIGFGWSWVLIGISVGILVIREHGSAEVLSPTFTEIRHPGSVARRTGWITM